MATSLSTLKQRLRDARLLATFSRNAA